MNSEWFRESFGADYLRIYAHRNDDEASMQADFVEACLKPPRDSRMLDLCCGSGRHVREFADRGYNIVGLDLSKELLGAAVGGNEISGCRFVRGDMRTLPFMSGFDFVFSLFTSFGYFEREEQDEAVLHSISNILRHGGFFVLDYLNPDHVRANLVPEDCTRLLSVEIRQERCISGKRIEKCLTVTDSGKIKVYHESVRLYSLGEIRSMMEKAGMAVRKVYGDFDGSRFGDESPRMIIFAEKV
ncbi:MAG: class I SAM-dependent methyltransferase [Planctomycetota bacterium]